jgi:outer membrane protein TolC
MKASVLFLFAATCAMAEVHTMTLEQALERALQQNPDVIIDTLNQRSAEARVLSTQDPFSMKASVGSGLAYTYGFPSTMDGQAPALFTVQLRRAILDKPQSYRISQAQENVSGAAVTVRQRKEDIAYRVTTAFLDAENALRMQESAAREVNNRRRSKATIDALVAAQRELPRVQHMADIDVKNALLNAKTAENSELKSEVQLAQLLGMPPGDRVRPALEERLAPDMPVSEEGAIATALSSSLEIRRLESDLRAKQLEAQSYKAERYPKINLIGQYQILSKINNYDEFYPRFQRHNFQIGASIEIPILAGNAPKAGTAQVEADLEKIRRQIASTRGRISADMQTAYSDLEVAEATRDVRREALDVARENVTYQLNLNEEGRATPAQVEAARADEEARWLQYYEAQTSLEVARLNIRRQTGTILAGIR